MIPTRMSTIPTRMSTTTTMPSCGSCGSLPFRGDGESSGELGNVKGGGSAAEDAPAKLEKSPLRHRCRPNHCRRHCGGPRRRRRCHREDRTAIHHHHHLDREVCPGPVDNNPVRNGKWYHQCYNRRRRRHHHHHRRYHHCRNRHGRHCPFHDWHRTVRRRIRWIPWRLGGAGGSVLDPLVVVVVVVRIVVVVVVAHILPHCRGRQAHPEDSHCQTHLFGIAVGHASIHDKRTVTRLCAIRHCPVPTATRRPQDGSSLGQRPQAQSTKTPISDQSSGATKAGAVFSRHGHCAALRRPFTTTLRHDIQ
mmetsp:Transcript_6811/g.19040  ORF Transcript_6811/g.19040 Transcript_6811/m.19040 type:complete len:306 (+) Transcript_6811:79-996(+)